MLKIIKITKQNHHTNDISLLGLVEKEHACIAYGAVVRLDLFTRNFYLLFHKPFILNPMF